MPYIGKGANGFGIRERYRYSASGSQTAFTDSDLDSKTLQFDSGSLLDVYLNGVLLDTADYNTSTANTVTLTSGATASDEVMIVVYDVFSLSDAMPKTGGTFTGAVTHTGAFTSKGIDDNADATAITITSDEAVGIGKSLTPNNYSGYQSLTIGGSDATTGATLDLEDSSGNLEGRINGTNGIVYIEADPNGSTGASKISLEVDGSAKMVIDANGHVTMPSQTSFLATFNTENTNIATNTAVHQYFDNEVYDVNADYASNTFTAPVTGKYILQVRMRVDNIPTDANYIWFYIQTSNRVHTVDFFDPDNFDQSVQFYTVQGTVIADMDASDTATFNINQNGGTQATDPNNGDFSGYLLG